MKEIFDIFFYFPKESTNLFLKFILQLSELLLEESIDQNNIGPLYQSISQMEFKLKQFKLFNESDEKTLKTENRTFTFKTENTPENSYKEYINI